MPHVTLEYTGNVRLRQPLHDLFRLVHAALAEVAGVRLENCKSRAVELNRYCVGAGLTSGAFVHMDVRFLEGRSADRKAEVGRQLLALLRRAFPATHGGQGVQFTVAVTDLPRSTYFKYPEGTL